MNLLEFLLLTPLIGSILLVFLGHRPSGGGWLNVAVSALTLALSLP